MKYFISYRIAEISAYGRCEVTLTRPISSLQQVEEIEKEIEWTHAGGKDQGKVVILGWQKFKE